MAEITAQAVQIEGAILANGQSGGNGGGSGGSILLHAGTLAGSGIIAANGGTGPFTGEAAAGWPSYTE